MTDAETLANTNPRSQHPRQWSRQIQACRSDVDQCLNLLKTYQATCSSAGPSCHDKSLDEAPFLAALKVCGRAKRPDLAIAVYREFPSSEACRSLAISICGASRHLEDALSLLRDSCGDSAPSAASYNAVISACGQSMAWKEALEVLQSMPASLVSTLTCNAVLTALARSRRGSEAYALLQAMKKETTNISYPPPDRISYHNTILALVRASTVDQACQLLNEMKQKPHTLPKQSTYDTIIAALNKQNRCDEAHALQQELSSSCSGSTGTTFSGNDGDDGSFRHWKAEGMTKVGRGKSAYWTLGTYTTRNAGTLALALQPHRNPAKNGISLLLLDPNKERNDNNNNKLGYLLMINDRASASSSLLGLFVHPSRRKQGLSKVFLALWMNLCDLSGALQPVTGVMKKPLLALSLQHTFGYVPQDGGVEVHVSVGEESSGTVALYPTSAVKSLHGAFSPRDIQRERLVLPVATTSPPPGRLVKLGARYIPPTDDEAFRKQVSRVLTEYSGGNGKLELNVTGKDLQHILLGT